MKEHISKKIKIDYIDNHFIIRYRYMDKHQSANAPIIMKKAIKLICSPDDFLFFMNEYQRQMKGGKI